MTQGDVTRAMIAYAIDTARNRGLEEAARLADRREPKLARAIRARMSTPESHLAEVKVHTGKIRGLLPAPGAAA